MVDFYAFLKVLHFSKFFEMFRDFRNASAAHAKVVKCTLFHLNTIGRTQ